MEGEPILRVLTGLHAGATFTLRDSSAHIGGGEDADVILADDGVLVEHVVLEVAGGGLRLTALAAGVTLDGCPVANGDVLAAAAPLEFEIAGVRLRYEAPQAPAVSAIIDAPPFQAGSPTSWLKAWPETWPKAWHGVRPIRWVAYGGVLVLVVGLGVRALTPVRDAGRHQVTAASAAAPGDRARSAALDPAAARREVEAKLAEAGLTNLRVVVNGTVATVSGQVDPASVPRWRAVEVWADRRFGRQILLVPAVSIETEHPITIALDAVWNGPEPNVVVHGERYGVGATLPGGWRIAAIEERRILVEKEGRTHALSY